MKRFAILVVLASATAQSWGDFLCWNGADGGNWSSLSWGTNCLPPLRAAQAGDELHLRTVEKWSEVPEMNVTNDLVNAGFHRISAEVGWRLDNCILGICTSRADHSIVINIRGNSFTVTNGIEQVSGEGNFFTGVHLGGDQSITSSGRGRTNSFEDRIRFFGGLNLNSFDLTLQPLVISNYICLDFWCFESVFTNVETNFIFISSPITGSGIITKTASGILVFDGGAANANTNETRIHEGTLLLSNTAVNVAIVGPLVIGDGLGGTGADVVRLGRLRQIANNVRVTVNSSGVLDLDGHSEAIGSLAGSGLVQGNDTDFETGSDNTSTSFSGVISGAGNFWKHGTGTQTLGGNNTYTGRTIVEGNGSLIVNGLQPQSSVTVSNSAELGGSGTVGHLTVTDGGVKPGSKGDSAAILTSSNASFTAASTFGVQLNGTTPGAGHDQLNVRGTVNLGGCILAPSASFPAASAPVEGTQFIIINNDGTEPVSGTFAGRPNHSLLTIGGSQYRIDYDGGTGNDVVLTLTNTSLRVAASIIGGGNGNATLDPEECAQLSIVLTNTGATVTGIQATLLSETPGVTVTKMTADYPDLPAGSRRTNTVPFQIRTSPSLTCGAPVALRLVVQTGNAGTYAVPFVWPNNPAAGPPVRFENASSAIIPGAGTLNRTFAVSNITNLLARVELSLHISHPSAGELSVFLVSPGGTRVALTTGNGGTGNNYGNSCTDTNRTLFSDLGTTSITSGSAPFVGVFRPEGLLGNFAGLSGPGVNGTWTLEISDDSIFNTGNFNCASLVLYPATCPPGGGGCGLCPNTTLAGAIGPGGPEHAGRRLIVGEAGTCAAPKACPGTSGGGSRYYEAYVFYNSQPDACIAVTLTTTGPSLTCAIYTNSFDPANLCANYVSDIGQIISSSDPSGTCFFKAGADQPFVVVVAGASGSDEGSFTLAVTGGDCRPQLGINREAGGLVALTWSASTVGYQLEGTNRMPASPGPWPPVTNTPVIMNGRYRVTTSGTSTNAFYRLNKP